MNVRTLKPYLLLAPGMALITIFILYPIGKAISLSFSSFHFLRPEAGSHFVGLSNFVRMASDPKFLLILKNTMFYVMGSVAGAYAIGLLTALLLNMSFKGRRIARSLIIIVWAVPGVVACMVWIYMYNVQWGVINYILMRFGLIRQPVRWLMDANVAMLAVIFTTIWKTFPFATVTLLGGLQTVPKQLYEAARMDGGNALQLFRHITMPQLKPITAVVILLFTIWTMRNFDIIYIMTNGGPGKATATLVIQAYQQAFQAFDFAGASAIGVISLVISLAFSIIYLRYVYVD